MALGQESILFLELSANGAGDETVVLVDIATEPALSDAPMTVTLMGDDEVTLTIALPDGTMQGVVTASATDCAGSFIEVALSLLLALLCRLWTGCPRDQAWRPNGCPLHVPVKVCQAAVHQPPPRSTAPVAAGPRTVGRLRTRVIHTALRGVSPVGEHAAAVDTPLFANCR